MRIYVDDIFILATFHNVCLLNVAPQVTVPECVFSCLYFAEAGLVRLEEQPVHIGQLHFVIVKQDELCKEMIWQQGRMTRCMLH